jgi:threonine dehydrogenase-like Zn-dependent dehydrogenase
MPTCRALQITAPGEFDIIEMPVPQPGDDEVLIRVEACATCTNWELQTWRGTDIFDRPGHPLYPQNPGSPGHEAAGVVEAVGAGVSSLTEGDKVAVLGSTRGPENDAHAQYVTRPEGQVAKLPADVDPVRAAPLEMALCAVRSIDLEPEIEGASVGVVGLGPAGMLHLQVARARGAHRVIGVDPVLARREAAAPLANRVADPGGDGPALLEERVDVVFECSGSAAGMAFGLRWARLRLHVFSVPSAPVEWGKTSWLRGVAIEPYHWRGDSPAACLRRAAAMLEAGEIDTTPLISRVLPYSRYAEGLRLLETREAIKVVYQGWD